MQSEWLLRAWLLFNSRFAARRLSKERAPGTIWLGAGLGSDSLGSLVDRIEAAMAKLGFRREGRSFHPHLTLGRVRGGGPANRALGKLLLANAGFEAGQVEIAETIVFSSELHPTGPTYKALCRAKLGAT